MKSFRTTRRSFTIAGAFLVASAVARGDLQPTSAPHSPPLAVEAYDGPGMYYHGPGVVVVALHDGGAIAFDTSSSGGRNARWETRSPTWRSVANPPAELYGANAVELGDGRVLMVGSAEHGAAALYDRSNDHWTATSGTHPVARLLPRLIPVDGGRVVVLGGQHFAHDAPARNAREIELFDSASSAFRLVAASLDDRAVVCAARAGTHEVLVLESEQAGGNVRVVGQRVDATTGRLVATASLPSALAAEANVECRTRPDGSVLVWAVRWDSNRSHAAIVIASYDPGHDRWVTDGTAHPAPARYFATVPFGADRLLFVGDDGLEYDAQTGVFEATPALHLPDGVRIFDGVALLGDRDALLVGRTTTVRVRRTPRSSQRDAPHWAKVHPAG